MKPPTTRFEDRIWHVILNPGENPEKVWTFVRGISGFRLGPFGSRELALGAFNNDQKLFIEGEQLARDYLLEQDKPCLDMDHVSSDPVERDVSVSEQNIIEGYVIWPVITYDGGKAFLLEGPQCPIPEIFLEVEDTVAYIIDLIGFHPFPDAGSFIYNSPGCS